MQERLKDIRKTIGMTQTEFGQRIGVAQTTIAGWELGTREIPDMAIQYICDKFEVSENWLRYGEGEMFLPMSREEDLGRRVRRLFSQRPESFQRALITALLRFDPDGPEWVIVEKIFQSVYDEWQQGEQMKEADNDDSV